jgi:hypothetical protein
VAKRAQRKKADAAVANIVLSSERPQRKAAAFFHFSI